MKTLREFIGGQIPYKLRTQPVSNDTKPLPRSLARTPHSNTGYDSQVKFAVGVDWLDFTLRKVGSEGEAEKIIRHVEWLTGDSIQFAFTRPVFNGRMWDGSGNGVIGTKVWWDNGQSDDEGAEPKPMQLKFALSGKVMAQVKFVRLARWLVSLASDCDLDCSRIDLCVDDKESFVKMERITQAYKANNFFNAKHCGIQGSKNRGDNEALTYYFGHPQSHKRLRIYDKFLESGGKIAGIRWEAQFRKAVAHDVLFTLLEKTDDTLERTTEYIKNLVTGIIDFRDRSGSDPNRARCKVLPWFKRFCKRLRAEPVRVTPEVREPLVQRSIDWLDKSVAQSLAVVKKVLKDDFPSYLETTIKEGEERLNNRKRELILRTNREMLLYSTA